MGNVNMEAYQVHYRGDESVADHLRQLDLDVEKAAVLPGLPTAEGKTVLTAITDDQGDTELTYETPEVESEDIAPAFSEETEYSEGDLVYYDGILYKFAADHTAGSWDPSEVTQTTVAAEFSQLKNTIMSVEDALDAHTISNNTKVTLAINTDYTTLSDGYFRVVANNGNNYAIGLINGINMAVVNGTSFGSVGSCCFFVRKGTVIKFSGTENQSVGYFYPLA